MNNFKKLTLATCIVSTLAVASCFGMGAGNTIPNYRKEFNILRGKLNELISYLQLLNKIQPGSEAAITITTIMFQQDSLQNNPNSYKEKIKTIALYLKTNSIITNEEYNTFVKIL